MRNGYRLLIKCSGRWHTGLKTYETAEEAKDRRLHMISMGLAARDIKVVTEEEIFG